MVNDAMKALARLTHDKAASILSIDHAPLKKQESLLTHPLYRTPIKFNSNIKIADADIANMKRQNIVVMDDLAEQCEIPPIPTAPARLPSIYAMTCAAIQVYLRERYDFRWKVSFEGGRDDELSVTAHSSEGLVFDIDLGHMVELFKEDNLGEVKRIIDVTVALLEQMAVVKTLDDHMDVYRNAAQGLVRAGSVHNNVNIVRPVSPGNYAHVSYGSPVQVTPTVHTPHTVAMAKKFQAALNASMRETLEAGFSKVYCKSTEEYDKLFAQPAKSVVDTLADSVSVVATSYDDLDNLKYKATERYGECKCDPRAFYGKPGK